MRGDISRINLEQARRYSSVRMQQGRVQLDSDWNEQVDILDKLRRQLVRDVIGEACIPEDSESEGALEVTEGAGELHVAPGRIWIDGVRCEVDGEHTIELPGDDGNFAVYLETWERCVTAVEDPSLLEVALGGPDTTTRSETLCEVGIIAMEGSECSDSWDPPATTGRLTAFAADVAAEEPCAVPAASGYQRVENDLYRIEIHSAGNTADADPPSFKWARHNASVLAP